MCVVRTRSTFCCSVTCSSSIRAPDGGQERLEPRHVLADVQIEIGEADVLRSYSLLPDLGSQLGILPHFDNRVVQSLQYGPWRLGGSEKAVPGGDTIVDAGRERGRYRDRLAHRLIRRNRERNESPILQQRKRERRRGEGRLNAPAQEVGD